jgi:hypothetical protein
MAYITSTPKDETLTERFQRHLGELQSAIDENFPQLKSDVDRLLDDLKESMAQQESSGDTAVTDSGKEIRAQESTELEIPPADTNEVEDKNIDQRVQKVLSQLKEINADELAGNVEELYQQWKILNQNQSTKEEKSNDK